MPERFHTNIMELAQPSWPLRIEHNCLDPARSRRLTNHKDESRVVFLPPPSVRLAVGVFDFGFAKRFGMRPL
jgi:hypothetical protein